MATGDASHSPAACGGAEKARGEDPGGPRVEKGMVETTAAAPETSSGGEQPGQPAGLGGGARWEPSSGGPQEPRQQWKKFLYCEPHKRIKEVLEEELYIKRDECHITNPPAVALEGIWSIKRNLPLGGLKPGLQSRNDLLSQAEFYSRHGRLRSVAGHRRAVRKEVDSDLPFSQEARYRRLTSLGDCAGSRAAAAFGGSRLPCDSKARVRTKAIKHRGGSGKELRAGPGARLGRWARPETPGIP
ncbi:uncharacterized protein C11orf97 homolog [Pteronotus mesoamericanus]|uniref:uncharacterized protein C11orf97 homolog n=1 Tax=Pteronotus mesoamericanus TaxID=1884717 RepID=UPI0023ECC14B|nr:uncharacterized protein C11orf97 homolog [Pteronotus parnellii mesoamericanus]